MAVKPENRARSAMNKLIPLSIHREKMGSPYSAGTADQWYSANPFDLWVEFKFLPKPPTRPFTLALSALQLLWLEGRYNEKRAVGVILMFPAKYGCWMFFNREWEGKIDPSACVTYSRQEVADFITRSCTNYADYSALICSGEGLTGDIPRGDVLRRHLLHNKGD